jgi:outer membrane protein TolC
LCTLLGVPPHDLTAVLGEGDIPAAPAEVAVGIPADLMRRRPDIRAAERAVAAQSEQIGIALADLYPHFSIQGEFAVESENLGNLFTSASTAGSIRPSLRWDLLNYGRILNNVRLQESGLEELIAGYQNTVLTANQEVEDALVAFLNNQQRVRLLEDTVKETKEALRLLTLLFDDGEIDFTGVFVLQADLVAKQDQLAQARGDVVTSLIALYKALGGGWEIRCLEYETPIAASQPPAPLEIVPAPEATPTLPEPSDDQPPAPPADVVDNPFTEQED